MPVNTSHLVGNYFRKNETGKYYPINDELFSFNNDAYLELKDGALSYINHSIADITGYQKGTFRQMEDVRKLGAEDLKDYPFLTITDAGVMVFDKTSIVKQKAGICWLHSIINSFLLPDRMRLIIGNYLLKYLDKYINHSPYGRMYAQSLFDGQLNEIPMKNKNESMDVHFKQFMIFKYFYVYLYDFYEINKASSINPHRRIGDRHILDSEFDGKESMAILAHAMAQDTTCASYFKNAAISGQNTEYMYKIFESVFGTMDIQCGDCFQFFEDNESLKLFKTNDYELESWSITVVKEKMVDGRNQVNTHALVGFKKNGGFFIVDSNFPHRLYQIKSHFINNGILSKPTIHSVVQLLVKENYGTVDKLRTIITLSIYIKKGVETRLPLKTETEVQEAIINAKRASDAHQTRIEEALNRTSGGGKQTSTIVYQTKKYIIHIDPTTKSKYIRVKKTRVFLRDIRRRYRYVRL